MNTNSFARRIFLALLPALFVVGATADATAQDDAKRARDVSQYNLGKKDALAIEGYDPVAYFPEGGGEPAKGKADFQTKHDGVLYRFSSKKNLELFEKNPGRFEPRYGGWCAYAMSQGEKVEVDPKSFIAGDDGLLLFYKGFFNDTRKKWQKDPAALEKKADAAWVEILDQAKKK